MSLIAKLENIMINGKFLWEKEQEDKFNLTDIYCRYEGAFNGDRNILNDKENRIINGDNLNVMKCLAKEDMIEKFQFIYADPPFFSKTDYKSEIKNKLNSDKTIPVLKQKAYKDSWENGMEEYLTMLTARLYGFLELLKDDGIICMHLDWHAVHYIKVIMDEVFGEKNFVNEIIWNYKSGGVSKRRFARKHDTLLLYSKTKDYKFNPRREKSYNRGLKPYRFKGVKEYKDEIGWYTLVNMKDVWQLDMVGRTSAERTGYATQKPETLLARLIDSCTDEGDLCGDFFGGSGTTAASCEKKGRRWISCDKGKLSSINTLKRMIQKGAKFQLYSTEKESIPYDPLDVDIDIKTGSTDKNRIEITLNSYSFPDDAQIPVEEKEMSLISEILNEDWVQLVDYFAVDFDYDGNYFCPHKISTRGHRNTSVTLTGMSDSTGTIAVKVIDIFGNSSLRIY